MAMRPALLHLDEALAEQSSLLDRVQRATGHTLNVQSLGPALRLWSRPPALSNLKAILRTMPYDKRHPDFIFSGSGDFHHVSSLLIERVCETLDGPLTILHFDNHPDWVKFADGLHCGSWAAQVARRPNVDRVLTIGVNSRDLRNPHLKGVDLDVISDGRLELYAYKTPNGDASFSLCGKRWPTIEPMGQDVFIKYLQTRIHTKYVYVTIDKDVLRTQDACTNWDQGALSLDALVRMLQKLSEANQIVGADIVGDWSPPVYGHGLGQSLLKQAEAFIDQPKAPQDLAAARAINERTNIRLFEFFAGCSA